jgi:hypothetical protein
MVEGNVRAERTQLSKKMDKVQLSMFNKAYHMFLSNPVKISKNYLLDLISQLLNC